MRPVYPVKPRLSLRRVAIANDLFEILQARGVNRRDVAVLQSGLRLAGAEQPLDVGI
jgi:hypothetical protein